MDSQDVTLDGDPQVSLGVNQDEALCEQEDPIITTVDDTQEILFDNNNNIWYWILLYFFLRLADRGF